jgi:pimeloyl-ACP methyl ester carboxylesterase
MKRGAFSGHGALHSFRAGFLRLVLIAHAVVALAGCATPIGVTRVDPRAAQYELNASALTSPKPSAFSARELLNLNLYELYDDDPKEALAKLHRGLAPTGDEDRLFALAELSFLHAENSGDRAYYLAATLYASAYLLPGKNGERPRPIDPRARWSVDIFNRALAGALTAEDGEQVVLKGGQYALPFGELTASFDERDLLWAGFRLKDFISANELQVRGLRNRYREPGVGAPLVAGLEPVEALANAQFKRIPPRLKIAVTAFLRYDDARAALASAGPFKAKLELYNPDSTRTVKVHDVDVPIEFERSAAFAATLEGAPVWDFEIAGFRSGEYQVGAGDGLFIITPYRHGRIPLVLVHGTASSPARWSELVNELANDPIISERYELWYFIYNTGNPIAYSAKLLRDALTKVIMEVDPEGKDPGLKQLVVMGHSQGGLLTKMTAIDSGMRLWPFTVPPDQLDVGEETRELVTQALIIKPLPFVKRVVFVATPHRGSYQALGLLGRIGAWLVSMPGRFAKMSFELLTLQTKGLLIGPVRGIPTSIDNMNPTNPFIQSLASIPIADGIVAHSIIAVDSDGPLEEGGDGVVKYVSAHIDGVASEKVVRSGHSVQGNPEAIQEVRRILLEHLKQ